MILCVKVWGCVNVWGGRVYVCLRLSWIVSCLKVVFCSYSWSIRCSHYPTLQSSNTNTKQTIRKCKLSCYNKTWQLTTVIVSAGIWWIVTITTEEHEKTMLRIFSSFFPGFSPGDNTRGTNTTFRSTSRSNDQMIGM